jgi:hypothetical protein
MKGVKERQMLNNVGDGFYFGISSLKIMGFSFFVNTINFTSKEFVFCQVFQIWVPLPIGIHPQVFI